MKNFNYKNYEKKAVFFSTDALIALIIIFVSIFILLPSFMKDTRSENFISNDFIKVYSTLKIGKLQGSFIQEMINNKLIRDLNKTVLEQIGEFYVVNKSLAKNLSEFVLEKINSTDNLGIYVNNERLANKSRMDINKANNLDVERQFISGLMNTSYNTTGGYSSRAYLSNLYQIKYFYFGGHTGDGNITIIANINGTIKYIDMEAVINEDFELYINDKFVKDYLKSNSLDLMIKPGYYNLTEHILKFVNGENNISFRANQKLFIEGGFIKITYKSNDIENYERYYFQGIDGIINNYDGFYVPDNLETMKIRLHFNSSENIILTIENKTIFKGKSEDQEPVDINDADLRSILDNYQYIKGKNLPLRITSEGYKGLVSYPNTNTLIIGSLGFEEKDVGTDKECVVFPYDVGLYKKSPNPEILCRYDPLSGKILGSRPDNRNKDSYAKCAYICRDKNELTFARIEIGTLDGIVLRNKKLTKYIGANKECIAFINNTGRTSPGPENTGMNASCTYDKTSGLVIGNCTGRACGNGITQPGLTCNYLCINSPDAMVQNIEYFAINNFVPKNIGKNRNCINSLSQANLEVFNFESYCNYNKNTGIASGGTQAGAGYYKCSYLCLNNTQDSFNQISDDSGLCNDNIKCNSDSDCGDSTYTDDICIFPGTTNSYCTYFCGTHCTKVSFSENDIYNSAVKQIPTIPNARFIADILTGTKLCQSLTNNEYPILEGFGLAYECESGSCGSQSACSNLKTQLIYFWNRTGYQNKTICLEGSGSRKRLSDIKELTCRKRGPFEKSPLDDFAVDDIEAVTNVDNILTSPPLPCSTKFAATYDSARKLCEIKGYSGAYNFNINGFTSPVDNWIYYYENPTMAWNKKCSSQDCTNIDPTAVCTSPTTAEHCCVSNPPPIRSYAWIGNISGIPNYLYCYKGTSLKCEGVTIKKTSKLFPDSYIEFGYPKPNIEKGLTINFEKNFINNNTAQFYYPEDISNIYETYVTSYSGPRWTKDLTVNDNVVYNLTIYNKSYFSLGDPYRLRINKNLLVKGIINKINLTTGLGESDTQNGSMFNKIMFKIIKNFTTYSPISPTGEGCNWTIMFEDDTNLTISVPEEYIGINNCNYTSNSIKYDNNDAYQKSIYDLLVALDLDSNHKVDMKLDLNNLKIDISEVKGIPYSWALEVQIRRWY